MGRITTKFGSAAIENHASGTSRKGERSGRFVVDERSSANVREFLSVRGALDLCAQAAANDGRGVGVGELTVIHTLQPPARLPCRASSLLH